MIGKDSYLNNLVKTGVLNASKEAILDSIEKNGFWEEFSEWRMSVGAHIIIKPLKVDEKLKYRVESKIDYEFACTCPTIDRAIEMAKLFQQLSMKLDTQIGWPSWVSKTQMELDENNT